MIRFLVENWEDQRRSEEVADMIAAIVAELQADYREAVRKGRMSPEEEAYWEGLMDDVQNEEFWGKFDHLLNFSFRY